MKSTHRELGYSLIQSLAPLTHTLALLARSTALIRSCAHSLAPEKEGFVYELNATISCSFSL